jgi:hypothetical protein
LHERLLHPRVPDQNLFDSRLEKLDTPGEDLRIQGSENRKMDAAAT